MCKWTRPFWRTDFGSQKRTPKPKNRTNSAKEFFEQFEGVAGHYPLKQGVWGKSQQKVHPKVRRNLCRKSSLGYPFCPRRLSEVTQKPFLSSGSLSLQCRHWESSKVLAGLAFCEMLSQYPHNLHFRGSPGVARWSTAVCDPDPPRPFARSRPKDPKSPKSLLIATRAAIYRSLPWPSNPCFFGKSKGFFPTKARVFSLRGTPKILGKERKNAQKKQGKSENEKSKEIEKSKDWRVRVWALQAKKSQESLKRGLFWGSAKKSPKNSLESPRMTPKIPFSDFSWLFLFDFLGCFQRLLPWTGKSCSSNRASVKAIFEALKCL